MSKDWNEDESTTEQTPDGEEVPAAATGGRGKRTFFTLGTVAAVGLVLTLKGGRLYDRFWPASPQSAGAAVTDAPRAPAITITRTDATPATKPARPLPANTPVAARPAPARTEPATTVTGPAATQPAAKPVSLASLFPPFPPAPAPTAGELTPKPTTVSKLPGRPAPAKAPAAAQTVDDPRLAETRSTLENLRGQLQLYPSQHAGKPPEFAKYPAWHQLTQRTRADGTVDPEGPLGPYLDAAPVNPLNESGVIGLTGRTPQPGQTLRTDGKLGWVYCIKTQTLHATGADGKTILDDRAAKR